MGTPETVVAALMDYVHLGVDILSARGYDTLEDAAQFGRYVIPLVRDEDRETRPSYDAPLRARTSCSRTGPRTSGSSTA